MPNLWDFMQFSRGGCSRPQHHNLQEGLFQIASQTCNILVQVNNTNNISYENNSTNYHFTNCNESNFKDNNPSTSTVISTVRNSSSNPKTSSIYDIEQCSVLLPATHNKSMSKDNSKYNIQQYSNNNKQLIAKNYKRRLSTVLESSTVEDDFELWDQGQMMRSHQRVQKWGNSNFCKPSCIPILFILILIILVVIIPILEHHPHQSAMNSTLLENVCSDTCNVQLVESIPIGLKYPNGPKHMSIFDAWQTLIAMATHKIDIGSFYWTLRNSDVLPYNHSSSLEGEKIFQDLLTAGLERNIDIRIAQSYPTQISPNIDTEILEKRRAAKVRSVNFPKLLGGGVLHTKVWIVDDAHFFVGSANMDWRSLTQVKELGIFAYNCSCLAKDVNKIFEVYWDLGRNGSTIPDKWPDNYSTNTNAQNPMQVDFGGYSMLSYFSSSPDPLSPNGRTSDIKAIESIILNAEKFVYISVMDYEPLLLYSPKIKFWPVIDNAIRQAAIDNKVTVKLLISYWNHSRSSENHFLQSLADISESINGVDIQVKRFIVPADEDQKKIPFGRVNHAKYMVTDLTAYIGTSNWSGDYFTNTAGIGFIAQNIDHNGYSNPTIRSQLEEIFERDWNSQYAVDQEHINDLNLK